jgi:hypothetical protein
MAIWGGPTWILNGMLAVVPKRHSGATLPVGHDHANDAA